MNTPFEKVLMFFHSRFQSTTELPPELEKQFLIQGVSEFETDLYDLNFNAEFDEFEKQLTLPELNVLGALMYKGYLQRERDRMLKLNNIIGRDIRLTGMSDTKFAVNKAYGELLIEIEGMIAKLKNFENFS